MDAACAAISVGMERSPATLGRGMTWTSETSSRYRGVPGFAGARKQSCYALFFVIYYIIFIIISLYFSSSKKLSFSHL
jgi:hypothetical protein